MKERPLIIGLTGGIGAGKSAALAAFARAGARTLSLDEVSHATTARGTASYKAIVKVFGRGVVAASGELDRAALGRLVFASARARRRLERITHPMIMREMRRRVAQRGRGVLVIDVPLLFEKRLETEFDATLVVAASARTRRSRVARRDGMKTSDVRRRMAAQLPESARIARADVVIRNDGSLDALRRTVKQYQQAFVLMTPGGK